jgi:hypothetical protein
MSYCYVTLIMGGNDYVAGALLMAYLFRKFNTKYEVNVMVTPDVTAIDDLRKVFDNVFVINYIQISALNSYINQFIKTKWPKWIHQYSWLKNSFTKFNLFNLPYDKICFLDADMFPLKNTDHVFSYAAPAGLTKVIVSIRHNKIFGSHNIKQSLRTPGFGIRGGLMLLNPGYGKLDKFIEFACKPSTIAYLNKHFKQINSGPDETLISLYYRHRWRKLNPKFMNSHYTLEPDNYFQHNYVEKPWKIYRDYPEFKLFYQQVLTMLIDNPEFAIYYDSVLKKLI